MLISQKAGRKMKKLYSLLLVVLLTVGALAGCAEKKDQVNEEKKTSVEKKTAEITYPLTLTDATQTKVTIEKKPEKIVSLIPSNTEIAFALGLDKEVVGVSDFDNYPESATKKENIGGQEINLEKIISL